MTPTRGLKYLILPAQDSSVAEAVVSLQEMCGRFMTLNVRRERVKAALQSE